MADSCGISPVAIEMITLLAQILLLLLAPAIIQAEDQSRRYAVAISTTPVLNSPGFKGIFGGDDGDSLKTDNCGQIRELEFIALPGTLFAIQEEMLGAQSKIYRVTTREYPDPPGKGLFIDKRFVRTVDATPTDRHITLPVRDEVIRRLRSAKGVRYVWGGNVREGISELPEIYPPKNPQQLTGTKRDLWQLAGLDCSGLLYEATGGWTPRNTIALVQYGRPVMIEGLSADSIVKQLRPLDLIVWPGHLLVTLDNGAVIESRLYCDGRRSGVAIRPLRERVTEIMSTRKPQNSMEGKGKSAGAAFVVRRWHETD